MGTLAVIIGITTSFPLSTTAVFLCLQTRNQAQSLMRVNRVYGRVPPVTEQILIQGLKQVDLDWRLTNCLGDTNQITSVVTIEPSIQTVVVSDLFSNRLNATMSGFFLSFNKLISTSTLSISQVHAQHIDHGSFTIFKRGCS